MIDKKGKGCDLKYIKSQNGRLDSNQCCLSAATSLVGKLTVRPLLDAPKT
jgi:hypothetical protein